MLFGSNYFQYSKFIFRVNDINVKYNMKPLNRTFNVNGTYIIYTVRNETDEVVNFVYIHIIAVTTIISVGCVFNP